MDLPSGLNCIKNFIFFESFVVYYEFIQANKFYTCEKTKWGLSGLEFLQIVIKCKLQFYVWSLQASISWDFIDNTDYTTHSVIILIKCYDSAFSVLHYMVIIGKRNDGKEYLLIDDCEQIYLVSYLQLVRAMKIDTPTVHNYSAYRVG